MGRRGVRCQVCYEDCRRGRKAVEMPCSCLVCEHCFAEWVKHCYSSASFPISCPTPVHKTVLSPVFLKLHLSKSDFRLYELTTFRRILGKATYIECPNCHLISWLETYFCFSSPSCAHCGFIWQSAVWGFLDSLTTWHYDLCSTFVKEITSSPCPSCLAPISKNGGCSRMLCSQCKAAFCALCGALQSSHRPERCYACIAIYVLWTFIVLGVLVIKAATLVPGELISCLERYGDAVGFLFTAISVMAVLMVVQYNAFANKRGSRVILTAAFLGIDIGVEVALYYMLKGACEEIGQVVGLAAVTGLFALPAVACYSRLRVAVGTRMRRR